MWPQSVCSPGPYGKNTPPKPQPCYFIGTIWYSSNLICTQILGMSGTNLIIFKLLCFPSMSQLPISYREPLMWNNNFNEVSGFSFLTRFLTITVLEMDKCSAAPNGTVAFGDHGAVPSVTHGKQNILFLSVPSREIPRTLYIADAR